MSRWLACLFLIGCDHPKHDEVTRPKPAPADATTPTPMLIDASDPAPIDATLDCKIESQLVVRIGTAKPVDCGQLAVGDPAVAFTKARDCVAAVAKAGKPFVVLWDSQGIDSRVADAYLGLDVGGTPALYVLYRLDFDGDPKGRSEQDAPHTTTSTCTSVRSLGNCGKLPLATTLCLECVGKKELEHCPK